MKRIIFLLQPLLFLFSPTVTAQSAESPVPVTDSVKPPYSFGEATVTADRRLSKDLIPVQRLESAQLQRLAAHSVADAVRYFSGVQIKDYGGIGGLKTVNIRSMGTNHVGVFYDGIELGNAQNGQVDLGRFSLDNMEAVSVYNGQRSAIFQPAKGFGSAGSVYLESRVPRFRAGERHNLRAVMKTGSFGTANPSFLWEQKVNAHTALSLSAEYLYTTGRYRFRYSTVGGYDTTAVRRNGDVQALRAEAGMYRDLPGGSWKTKAYVYRSGRGLPGAVVRGKFSHEDRQWDTNVFVQSSLRKRVSGKYAILFSGKYAYDYLHYQSDPRRDESTMYVDNRYRQQEVYLSTAQLLSPFRHWRFSVSADYQWNTLRADLYNFSCPTRHTALFAIATAAEYGSFKAQASLLGTLVADHVRQGADHMISRSRLTPTALVSWQPFVEKDFHVRGFYKRIFRMPTLNDLYYTFIGNTDLRPEFTNQYDIGFTWATHVEGLLRRIEVQADAYYNDVTDKIVAVPTSNQFRWTMMNLGRVEIRGADVSAQADWAAGNVALASRLTYTFQRAQDFTDAADAYYGDQIPYVPRHSGSIVLNASWRGWDADFSFIYTGARYDQRANIPENYAPEWYTSDISLSRTQFFNAFTARLTAEVNNLFNQQFEVVKGYPMPGTNFKLILCITL